MEPGPGSAVYFDVEFNFRAAAMKHSTKALLGVLAITLVVVIAFAVWQRPVDAF
jgi:hypothetical protein